MDRIKHLQNKINKESKAINLTDDKMVKSRRVVTLSNYCKELSIYCMEQSRKERKQNRKKELENG